MEIVLVRTSVIAAALALTAGSAFAQTPTAPANPDPWERTNRKFYNFHQSIDRAALRPAALGYRKAVPSPLRTGLRNAISNVGEPVVFANDVLQLRFGRAARTFTRFVGNSTIGIGGFVDIAGKTGLPHRDNGFGATLARYGAKPGPYLFIPLAGPSTRRDAFGAVVDIFTDPFTWVRFPGRFAMNTTRIVVGGLDKRAEFDQQLETINATATDPYATLRSLYLQNRQATLDGGEVNVEALPDFDDPGAGAAPPADAPAEPTPPAAAPAQ
jgi:phospholipid-binding lipoprotein MlaA